jgi:hypothetical protein
MFCELPALLAFEFDEVAECEFALVWLLDVGAITFVVLLPTFPYAVDWDADPELELAFAVWD